MRKVTLSMMLMFLAFNAHAATYDTFGVYTNDGRFIPHGSGGNIYIVPQNPIIPMPGMHDYTRDLNQSMQTQLMMEKAQILQMQRQQIQQQQRAEQYQRNIAWQRFLKEQGYDPGPIDGAWGPKTARAYQEYVAKQNAPSR